MPSEGITGKNLSHTSLTSGDLLAIFATPWLARSVSLPDLCLHLCVMFPFLCICLPTYFITTPTTLEQGRTSELTAFCSNPYFPNKVRSEVLKG